MLRNCAYVCVSPEGARERTPCDVKQAVRACTLFLGLDPANSRNCCIAGIASCGFDAQVNERANTYRGPAGTLKYLVALAVELVKLNSREFMVSTNDGEHQAGRFTLIAVGNTSSYGGGLRMCPTADAFDQHFEVTYVDKVTRRLLVRVLPKVFWGGHTKHRQVTQSVAQKIEIGGDEFPVYADGEKIGHGPVVITLHPGAMRVWQAQPTNTP